MPGRDYGQAYARLEEVLRDSSFIRSYDTPQRYTSTSEGHQRAIPSVNFDASLRTHNRFPPTPPPFASLEPKPGSSSQPGGVLQSQTHRADLSTPPTLTGLPTPEVTPPVRRDYLSPQPANSAARSDATSPFAESFRTAREDWWSANGSRISLPPDLEHENYKVHAVCSRKPSLRTLPTDVRMTPITTGVADSASPPTPSYPEPRSLERVRPFSSDSSSTPRGSLDSNVYVGAVIIDHSPPARSRRLRKVSKNLNLRSVSSPLPTSQSIGDGAAQKPADEKVPELHRTRDQSHMRIASQSTPSELTRLHWDPEPLDRRSLERQSLDRHSPEIERTPRKSYDRSFKSHLGASTVSVRSDFSASTLELNEATAIQLFPRNNNSIVMVNQPVTPAPIPTALDARLTSAVNFSRVRPMRTSRSEVEDGMPDSLLTSPRAAPSPPKLHVIPPSPGGTNSTGGTPVDKVSNYPGRRPSLLARARANSVPLVDSLGSLKRSATGSLQRSAVNRILSKRKPKDSGAHISTEEHAASQRVSSTGSSSQSKHTFREPHPFWDEDLLDSEVGYPSVAEDSRQPTASAAREGGTGGDDEDTINESNWSKWKRGGSGRGFLIGNSLGIMRGPTNVRRPVFPAMKDRRPGARGQQQKQAVTHNGHPRSASAPEHDWDFIRHDELRDEGRKRGGWRIWEVVKNGLKG